MAPSEKTAASSIAKGRFPEFPELDGFRGLALLLVLVEHTLSWSLRSPGPWGHWGSAGVILFFGLSGFLITGLLCAERGRTGRVDLRAFWVRRSLRIVPAMGVFVAIAALLKLGGFFEAKPYWRDFPLTLLFLRNLAGDGRELQHLWSVSLEQQYYLLWPLLFAALPLASATRAGRILFVGVVAWRTAAIAGGLHAWDSTPIYQRTDFRLDALIGGSLVAVAWHQGRLGGSWLRRIPPTAVLAALLAWTAWGSSLPGARASYITGQVLLALLLLARLVVSPAGPFAAGCRWGWLRWLGRRSYSIYIWQQLFVTAKTPDWGWVRMFPVDLVFAFAAGLASYHLVELPCLRLKSRWGGRRPTALSDTGSSRPQASSGPDRHGSGG